MEASHKPLRIYYSATSASVCTCYSDDLFAAYQAVDFDGVAIGFANQRMILAGGMEGCELLIVAGAMMVTRDEISVLQSYVDDGGSILLDRVSLLEDEDGQRHARRVIGSNDQLRYFDSLDQMSNLALHAVLDSVPPPALCTSQETCV